MPDRCGRKVHITSLYNHSSHCFRVTGKGTLPHAASMPCKLAGTQRLGHVYRVATLYYVLVGRCVAAGGYTSWDVLRYTPPDLSSCLVSFASAEIALAPSRCSRFFRKSMQIRMNRRRCSARPERCTAPLADKENLDSKTERVSSVNAAGHIKHKDHHSMRASMESSVAQ